jgi:hypothetical protein
VTAPKHQLANRNRDAGSPLCERRGGPCRWEAPSMRLKNVNLYSWPRTPCRLSIAFVFACLNTRALIVDTLRYVRNGSHPALGLPMNRPLVTAPPGDSDKVVSDLKRLNAHLVEAAAYAVLKSQGELLPTRPRQEE